MAPAVSTGTTVDDAAVILRGNPFRDQVGFTYRQALDKFDPAAVNGVEGALANAYKLTEEIVSVLRHLAERRVAA